MGKILDQIRKIYKFKSDGDSELIDFNDVGQDVITKVRSLLGGGMNRLSINSERLYHYCHIDIKNDTVICRLNFSHNIKCGTGGYAGAVKFKKDGLLYYIGPPADCELKIVIFDDDNIYMYNRNNRLIPLSLKKLSNFYTNGLFRRLIDAIFSAMACYSDIYSNISQSFKINNCILPVNFNDLRNYKNPRALFLDKYKSAKGLDIDFNALDINASYLVIKSLSYIEPSQKYVLENLCSKKSIILKCINGVCPSSIKGVVASFLTDNVLMGNYDIKLGYAQACMLACVKINLLLTSQQMDEQFDPLMYKYRAKSLPDIKIKEKSKFNSLRDKLPEKYKWLKSKRQISRFVSQRHMSLNSYADDINADTCQLYSYVFNKNEYVLVFRKYHGKFSIGNIIGVDSSDKLMIREEVKKLIS